MTEKRKLELWFYELGAHRNELPYELVRVFSQSDEEDLKVSIGLALDHIDRVLDFGCFLNEDDVDQDQLWFNLLAKLDSYSYYAALAIPLVRQVLEYKTNFIHEKVGSRCRLQWGNYLESSQSGFMLSSKREVIIAKSRDLASRLTILAQQYRTLSSSAEFAEWCKYFLCCCADLISLALRPSLESEEQ